MKKYQIIYAERRRRVDIIKSVSESQGEILNNIIRLYCPNGFELDPTYSKGNFYKDVPEPKHKFDFEPQTNDTRQCDSRHLPFNNSSVGSIVFDPPFVGGSRKDGKPGIIKERFGYYKNVPILWQFYRDSLDEFFRILKPEGVLVFKCQDTIENSSQYLSHIEIINHAYSIGFYPLDLFILIANNRLMSPSQSVQQHSRKYHSYFIVFKKSKRLVEYSRAMK